MQWQASQRARFAMNRHALHRGRHSRLIRSEEEGAHVSANRYGRSIQVDSRGGAAGRFG